MKIDLDDAAILRMAGAIERLRDIKDKTVLRPSGVISNGGGYISGLPTSIVKEYADTCEQAGKRALEQYREYLRAIADGKEVAK